MTTYLVKANRFSVRQYLIKDTDDKGKVTMNVTEDKDKAIERGYKTMEDAVATFQEPPDFVKNVDPIIEEYDASGVFMRYVDKDGNTVEDPSAPAIPPEFKEQMHKED